MTWRRIPSRATFKELYPSSINALKAIGFVGKISDLVQHRILADMVSRYFAMSANIPDDQIRILLDGDLKCIGYAPVADDIQILPHDFDYLEPPPYGFHRDPIFICVTPASRATPDGAPVISEMGLAHFDVRDVCLYDESGMIRVLSPGDRGRLWATFIKSANFLEDCLDNPTKGKPSKYAFGNSQFVQVMDMERSYEDSVARIRKLKLREGETHRLVIQITHDKAAERERYLAANMLWPPNVDYIWDLKKIHFANVISKALDNPALELEDLIVFLGVNIKNALLKNLGNRTRTTLEVFLAGLLLNGSQQIQVATCMPLTILPALWSTDFVNSNGKESKKRVKIAKLVEEARALGVDLRARSSW